jgi:methionyl-tRNA synthetase
VAKTSKPTFYITTPIYYVNDAPHIGHAYTTIIADALARFKRMAGNDVFFLTGTDEHGQKIEKAAAEKGLTPKELADKVVVRIKDLWQALNISNDYFIRTTEPFHEKGVQKIFKQLLDKGDIYKGTYQGWYCVGEENFLAEDVPLIEGGLKICPDCGRQATIVEESTYFFRLSAYAKPLLDFYESHPNFVRPQSRMNEVVSFVRMGLKDLSITRTTVKWGIPVPGDPAHTIYVWFDALHNYLTGIGYDWNLELYQKFWPATIHLIGKDILRFHAVFWPAFLMAAEFPLPRCVFGHGWWLKDETKMSKSKGNVLDPYVVIKAFGPDSLRYFLLREIPIGQDGNFSHEGFIHRVNSDLANDLGNLVHRTLTMIQSYFLGTLEEIGQEQAEDRKVGADFDELKEKVSGLYETAAINKALEEIWVYINTVNKYLADHAPWKLAKDPGQRQRLGRILYQTAAAIRGISYLLFPVMPESSQKIWGLLGEDGLIETRPYPEFRFEGLKTGQAARKPQPLFPRVDLEDFLAEESRQATQPKTEEKMDIVTFEEFKKMDLRVAKILKAERVPGTTKLLKMEADIGGEKRQMVAGVADTYAPEDMVGKELIVIVNLKPAVIRGIESQAMLLAAVIDDKAVIPFFDRELPPGAKVR